MTKTNKARYGVDAAATPARTSKSTRNRRPAEEKLAELKRRLHDIDDLTAAGAALGWDQATYMPIGGAGARGRQRAALSRLAHEKSADSTLGKLLDELEPYAATLPYDSNEASLVRVARREWEKARRVPAELRAEIARVASLAEHAWAGFRERSDFAGFLPHLERNVELGRRYAERFGTNWQACIEQACRDFAHDLTRALGM